MAITIKLSGVSEAAATITKLPASLERNVLLRMSQRAYDESYSGAERHSKKGNLLASLYNRAVPGGREVGHDPQRAPHALFVNVGSKPHEIRPKDKKALRWASGGKFFFSKLVHHPGYIGDAYVIGALTTTLREFQSIVDAAMKESA
jgi:hypothetical protein